MLVRRSFVVITAAALTLTLTMSLAMAGMRVNQVLFTALPTASDGTSLMMAAAQTTSNVDTSDGTTCTESSPCVGLSLNAQAVLTGISRSIADGAVVELIAQGIPLSVTCSNLGGNQSPGQNPGPVTAYAQELITSASITKRGTAPLDLTATFPSLSYPGGVNGCPNGNWTATLDAVRFTCATIRVTQGASVIIDQDYDLDGSCSSVSG
jgi:hypothetical protein